MMATIAIFYRLHYIFACDGAFYTEFSLCHFYILRYFTTLRLCLSWKLISACCYVAKLIISRSVIHSLCMRRNVSLMMLNLLCMFFIKILKQYFKISRKSGRNVSIHSHIYIAHSKFNYTLIVLIIRKGLINLNTQIVLLLTWNQILFWLLTSDKVMRCKKLNIFWP